MGPIRNPNWSTSGMRVALSYLGVEATSGNEKWFVGGVYKPPSISNEYFYTEFGQTVDKIISRR